MTDPRDDEAFQRGFRRLGGIVRFRLGLRRVLSWAGVGLCVGALGAGAAWWARRGPLRPAAALLGLAGAAAGAFVARRRRLGDGDLALYLDHRLGSHETLATALELSARRDGEDRPSDAARAVVLSQAERVVGSADPKAVRPRVLARAHGALVLGAAAIAAVSLLPLPPAPPAPPPPAGSDVIQGELAALERLARIDKVKPRDEAQRERLKRLADEARKLRDKVQAGTPRREALADLAKLQEGLAAEKLSLGDGEERQGLESALGKLAENKDLSGVERALGDRDLVRLDQEMEKLANRLEAQDRDRAKKALEEAAKAARDAKAENVAKALEEQKKRLDEQGKKNQKLEELAKGLGKDLPEEAKQALEGMKKSGSERDQKRLAEAMEKALEGLSPEERKQLAENLKKQAEELGKQAEKDGGPKPGAEEQRKELEDLAKKLGSPEGQKELAEQMKELAKKPPPSDEAQRQKELGEKQKDAGDAQRDLGQPTPVPVPSGSGSGKGPGKDGPGKDGKDGPGKDGKDGPGKDGKDRPGKDGKDGKDGPGEDGKDGPGKSGKDGKDGPGKSGKDGKDGPGKSGKDGKDGKDGPGKSGKDGKDGKDGDLVRSDGGGPGKHDGKSEKVDGDGFRAKANAKLGKGKMMPGQVLGRSSGRPGEKANVVGTGALGDAKAGELNGIDRSEVPEEYREQVGRYFDPR